MPKAMIKARLLLIIIVPSLNYEEPKGALMALEMRWLGAIHYEEFQTHRTLFQTSLDKAPGCMDILFEHNCQIVLENRRRPALIILLSPLRMAN